MAKILRRKKGKKDLGKIRNCRFCSENELLIDFKNVDVLKNYTNKRGKIIARRLSGLCAKHQRRVTEAVKRARYIGLMPYVVYIYR